jgi:uncharacterized protein involved in exopolysaccharide biosynthesis
MPNVIRETDGRDAARVASDEIDLLEFASVWWRYRYVLLAAAILAGGVTYVINRVMTPTWEARFRLLGSDPGVEGNSRLNMVAFRELVESPTQAEALLREFNLDQPPHSLTPTTFLGQHVSVEMIRDSTILDVAVRLKDRDIVVKVARRYAERVVESAQRLNTEGIDYAAKRILDERDATFKRLQEAEKAMRDFQRSTAIEPLRIDVENLLDRRPEAVDLNVRIQGERARVQQLEAELARQDKVRTTKRAVDPPATSGADLQVRGERLDPYINPVYEALERDLTRARTELAALEQTRKELVSRLQLDTRTGTRLAELYEAEARFTALTRAQEIASTAYQNAANKYEEARLESTVRSPRLQILDPALPPDRPVGPRALRNAAAAAMLAFALAAVVVLVRDPVRVRQRRRT